MRDQSVCRDEAISGQTTVSVANGVAVFRYDGETDCDEESTVTWTLDGVDHGEISGVSCAAVAAEDAPWLASRCWCWLSVDVLAEQLHTQELAEHLRRQRFRLRKSSIDTSG